MNQKSAGSKKEAIPKLVMQAQLGSKEAFDAALAAGDIKEVSGPDGKSHYHYERFFVKESKLITKGGTVKKYVKVTDEQATDVEKLNC